MHDRSRELLPHDAEPARDSPAPAGAPGKRTLTQRTPLREDGARRAVRLREARGRIEAIRDDYLARLDDAIRLRDEPAARVAAFELRCALDDVDRDLAQARAMTGDRDEQVDKPAVMNVALPRGWEEP